MRGRRAFLAGPGLALTAGLAGCAAGIPSLLGRRRIDADGLPASPVAATEFRGDSRRQGVFPAAAIPGDAAIEWAGRGLNTGEHTAAKASPVEAPDGDVIVAGDIGEVWRLRPDGEVVWRAATEPSTRGIHGTPVIANEAVYVGAYDGACYAFDLGSGERFWRRKLGDAIGSSPGYRDGTLYIAVEYYGPSGAMFALDAVTGETTWVDRRPTDHPHSTCAIDPEAGRLVVGANDGNLYAWSFPDLEFAWSFATGRPIKGPIAVADGSAFFGSWDRTVYRVDLASGHEEWAVETDGLVMSGPAVEPATDTVYIGSHDSGLYALDLPTGAVRWRFDTGGALIGCPTVAGDHVLAGSYDGRCYAVEKSTGAGVWAVEGVGRVTSTPLVVDGAVYFTDRASAAFLDDGSGESGAIYKVGPAR